MKTPQTQAPERFGCQSKRAETGSSVPVSVVPPPYRAERPRNPETTRPSWVAEKINNSRRQAQCKPCPRCGTDTLIGPDHDMCADTVRVDLAPVNRIQEVIALLAGGLSYDLIRGALYIREPWHIHADQHPHPIHLLHSCTKGTLW